MKKLVSMDDAKDQILGKIGTPRRDAYEQELKKELKEKIKKHIGKIFKRSYYSILVAEDRVLRVVQSGFTAPLMFHVIIESAYDGQEKVEFLTLEDTVKLIGCSVEAFYHALGIKPKAKS